MGTPPVFPAQVLDDVESYVDLWVGAAHGGADVFRWQVDLHADELMYLTTSLCNLDVRLADPVHRCPGRAAPREGRTFHLVLVEALLFAMAQAGPCQAAFADQLRPSWPVADQTAKPRFTEISPDAERLDVVEAAG